MNASDPTSSVRRSWRRPHWLLAAHLLLLHALAFGGWQIPAVRILWLGALGLFLLWQPFIAGERQMNLRQTIALATMALLSTLLLKPWLLLIWCGALAAVIGGRVLWTGPRLERTGYLLAFGYLVSLIIFGVVPEISPSITLAPLPRETIAFLLPLLLPLLLVFPAPTLKQRAGNAFDLFYGLTVFLALAVLVLGSLAYMQVGAVSYVESLFLTSLSMAGALLLLAWAWNPRAGIYGVGALLTRYMLALGLPLEQWLIQLSEISEKEPHPMRFLEQIMAQLLALPWIAGVQCDACGEPMACGEPTAFQQRLRRDAFAITVYFRLPAAPAMQWHVDWLLRLAAEFFLVKYQTHQLHQMSYVQAIYETGARVTHDVKNLLQSLQTLCYAAEQPGNAPAKAELFARQLPKIAQRLQATLDKLQRPQLDSAERIPAAQWWQALQERYALADIDWIDAGDSPADLLSGLFDSVADNLIQNALNKRQRESTLKISVVFGVDRNLTPSTPATSGSGKARLMVCDTGSAIPATRADTLLRAPMVSEDGLGIGLYHAAHQALVSGYQLRLSDNQAGKVCFSLAPSVASGDDGDG